MGKKNRSQKRRLDQTQDASPSAIAASLVGKAKRKRSILDSLDDPTLVDELGISPTDLAVTIRTLDALCAYANQETMDLLQLFSSSCGTDYKGLQRAIHPFAEAMHRKFDPIDYPGRVTSLLTRKQWADALHALQACAYYGSGSTSEAVKRGTIQRWVRLCDDCAKPRLRFKLMSAILKCNDEETTGGEPLNLHDPRRAIMTIDSLQDGKPDNTDDDDESDDLDQQIVQRTVWCPPTESRNESSADDPDMNHKNFTLPKIRVVHCTPAAERKPPNHYDLRIFATPENAIQMSPNPPEVQRHDITLIPGALLLSSVLTSAECQQIIATAEKMCFVPDHPLSAEQPTGIDTCEWLADKSLLEPLTQRVLEKLPAVLEGEQVAGINARWRLFRYGPGAVYRPHIDGSWPGSGVDENGKYQTDVFNGTCRSRMTFLMYLNDGFEGGGTTFYLPHVQGLEAVTVQPQVGNVLSFPQGNTASLVHEGSRVTSGGYKYVIRTDVLYHTKLPESSPPGTT